jgi:gliding motility-associated-like protein
VGIYKDTLQSKECKAFFEIKIGIKPKSEVSIFKYLCTTQPSVTIANKTYTQAGNYTDTLKTQTGCDSILTIEIKSLADFSVALGTDVEILEGEKINLTATTNYPNITKKFTWLPDNTTNCDTCKTINVAPEKTQWYAVKAQIEGCFVTDSINIKVLNQKLVFMPNAFSPNGDQINDVFRPYTSEAVAEIEYFVVYDRWGNHIFESVNSKPNDDNTAWNGTFKNVLASEGVYTYVTQVRLKNGKIQKYMGDVLLTR